MNKCCWDLCKFIVFIINFAALIVVGAVLGGAIYFLLKSEDILGFDIEPSLDSTDYENAIWFSSLLIIIVIFGFLVVFTFLGCCGAACHNQCMLGSFIIILFIFLGGYVAGIAYLFYTFPNEIEFASHELERTLPYYEVDENAISTIFWDNLQSRLGCCGVTSGFQDWGANADLTKENQKAPKSCCLPGKDCQYSPTSDNIYLNGCITKIELPFKIAFWSIPALMGFMLLSALIVCSRNKNSTRRHKQNRNSHSAEYSEETGYVYRGVSATPDYPSAPPYNPDYPPHQNPYAEHYPTGVIPPNADFRQPLIQPPSYHDVVNRR